jgi:hypothetical protein
VVTDNEFDELLGKHPTLYHMAERGSWPRIREYGLRSTTALLDLFEVSGDKRLQIEERHRPRKALIEHPKLGSAVVRDQIPMNDAGLLRCLPANLSSADWYKILNAKVFFWLSRERLLTMLKAGAYRDDAHDVLEVSTRTLVDAYRDSVWLSPMNSGCTKPYPHPRNEQTFSRIPQYPYAKRPRRERAVELAIDYAVPDIERFVTRVVEMRTDEEIRTLHRT